MKRQRGGGVDRTDKTKCVVFSFRFMFYLPEGAAKSDCVCVLS